jgi:hypothetical protein
MQKLAIVGTHPATRDNAPFGDESFDIWVFNEAPQADWCKRWTACFQMHAPEVYESRNNFVHKGHWEWLQEDHGADKVVWMQDVDARVPNSRRFPMDELPAEWHPTGVKWFTSTAPMCLALALHLGYEYIEVYGVELSSNTEYSYQLPCWLYWVGVARGVIGNNLVLKSGQEHFDARLYGYNGEIQIDKDYFLQRMATFEAQKKTLQSRMDKIRDRIIACTLDNKYDKFPDLITEAQNVAIDLGESAGALQEAEQFATRLDPIPRQQYERRAAQAQEDGDKQRSLMDKEFGKVEYVFNAWKLTSNYEALKQLRMFYGQLLEFAFKVGGNLGVMKENTHYAIEYDSRVSAAGGQRTLTALGVNNDGG